MRFEDLPPQWQDQVRDQIAGAAPVVEPDTVPAAAPEDATQALTPPYYVSVRVITRNALQSDTDNIAVKWALDELVSRGILLSDRSQDIKRICFEREKGEPEETIIEIWEM